MMGGTGRSLLAGWHKKERAEGASYVSIFFFLFLFFLSILNNGLAMDSLSGLGKRKKKKISLVEGVELNFAHVKMKLQSDFQMATSSHYVEPLS